MYITIKKINCQYRLKSLCFIALLGIFGVTAVGFYPVYRLQAAGADYTPQELNTSLETALKAREALFLQMTNDKPTATRPLGMLEGAMANGAPEELLVLLRAAITAVQAEITILKRCTETFPLSDTAAAKCLGELQDSSKKITKTMDAAIKKLQETIKMVTDAFIMPGRADKLGALGRALMLAQAQRAAVIAATAQWRRYAQGNMVRPPMPMPPPPTTPMPVPPPMDPPSPFSPVPDPDEDPPVTPPPITFTPPRPTNPVTPPRPTNPPPRPPRPVTIYVPTYQPGTSIIIDYEKLSMNNLPTLPAGWIYWFEKRKDGRVYAVPRKWTALPVAPPRPHVPLEALPSYR